MKGEAEVNAQPSVIEDILFFDQIPNSPPAAANCQATCVRQLPRANERHTLLGRRPSSTRLHWKYQKASESKVKFP